MIKLVISMASLLKNSFSLSTGIPNLSEKSPFWHKLIAYIF
jgi:hypothetical protein